MKTIIYILLIITFIIASPFIIIWFKELKRKFRIKKMLFKLRWKLFFDNKTPKESKSKLFELFKDIDKFMQNPK